MLLLIYLIGAVISGGAIFLLMWTTQKYIKLYDLVIVTMFTILSWVGVILLVLVTIGTVVWAFCLKDAIEKINFNPIIIDLRKKRVKKKNVKKN